jgi:hypothetical protein
LEKAGLLLLDRFGKLRKTDILRTDRIVATVTRFLMQQLPFLVEAVRVRYQSRINNTLMPIMTGRALFVMITIKETGHAGTGTRPEQILKICVTSTQTTGAL